MLWQTAVADATVRLTDKGGLGVLVPGGLIATATHCIEWVGSGMMALGEVYPSTVLCADKTTFRLGAAAADPVSDMAVLEALDEQVFTDDAECFEAWRERVAPVPLKHFVLDFEQSCPAFVLTNEGKWLSGRVTRVNGPPSRPMSCRIVLETEEAIQGGMSGGPVVSEDGKLLGVVSQTHENTSGPIPVAYLTLPRWVLDRIAASEAEPAEV
jgi:hypothetical protein